VPVFLLAERTRLSEIPIEAIQRADDFIWLLEDTTDFIAGRITAAVRRYEDQLLPPMLRALVAFSELHEYSWHTPGHTGGTAFLKSPVGRVFARPMPRRFLGRIGPIMSPTEPLLPTASWSWRA
jgi:hypothetical protein